MKKLLFTLVVIFFICLNLYSQGLYKFSFNGKNYEIVKEKLSWTDAALDAKTKGGYLVHIESKEEQNAVYSAIKSSGIPVNYISVTDGGGVAYIWIGANDIKTEGTWIWDGDNDGEGINFWNGQGAAGTGGGKTVNNSFVFWGGAANSVFNEPDNFANMQDAAAIGLEAWPKGMGFLGNPGEWNDISVSNTLYYIIEYDAKIDIPQLIKPSNNSTEIELKPTFSWNKCDADKYELIVSKSSDFNTSVILSNNLTDTFYVSNINLSENTKYYWKVRVIKGTSTGSWSTVFSFTTKAPQKPNIPILISPINGAIKVDVNPNFAISKLNNDTLIVQFSSSLDFNTDLIKEIKTIDTSFSVNIEFIKGKTYYWRACGKLGNLVSNWSEIWKFRIIKGLPTKPSLIEPKNNSIVNNDMSLSVTFKFINDDNVEKYKLSLSENSDLSSLRIFEFNNEKNNSYTLKEYIKPNTKYYWALTGINEAGEGEQSDIWSFSINLVDVKEIYENSKIKIISNRVILNESSNINIYDIRGTILQVLDDVLEVDLSDFTTGIYFIKIDNNIYKIVK